MTKDKNKQHPFHIDNENYGCCLFEVLPASSQNDNDKYTLSST